MCQAIHTSMWCICRHTISKPYIPQQSNTFLYNMIHLEQFGMFLIFILNIQHFNSSAAFFRKVFLVCHVQNHISSGIVESPGQFLLLGRSLGGKVEVEGRTSTEPSKGSGLSPCNNIMKSTLRILIRLLRWSLKRALRSLWKVLPSGQVHIFHSLHRSKERVEGPNN